MKKFFIIIVILVGFTFASFSQGSYTQYWLSSYTHNHNINPAIAPTNGYIYIPGINFNLSLNSNYTAQKFLYPLDNGQLGTFLHPDISADEFLNKLKKTQYLNMQFNEQLFSLGFYAKKTFVSIDLGVRADFGLNLPKDLFSFFKRPGTGYNSEYNFKNLNLYADVYAQLAVGLNFEIMEGLRVGAKLKVLASEASFNFKVNDLSLKMSGDEWAIKTNADLAFNTNIILPQTNSDGTFNFDKTKDSLWKDISAKSFIPCGYGAAIDLGVNYIFPEDSPLHGLQIGAGVTDLGFITYNKTSSSKFSQSGEVVFKGINDLYIDLDSANAIQGWQDEMDDFKNIGSELLDGLKYEGNKSATRMITTRFSAGVSYGVLKNKINLGLLYTGNLRGAHYYDELTLALTLQPSQWFGVAFSSSFLRQGFSSMGVALELFQVLHLAVDYVPFEFAYIYSDGKQVAPYPVRDGNFRLSLGISLPFVRGKKKLSNYDFCTDGVRGIY
jgi:hypothetical protein